MNKQRNMLLEMTVLTAFIAGICFLIWNINFYPAHSVKPSASDKPVTVNAVSAPKDANWEEGKTLFRSNCASCHNITENSTGPALVGATRRWENAGSYKGKTGSEWLKVWVKNWKDVVAAGYPYGVDMARSREAEMNIFTNLTDKQIDLILHYADTPKQTGSLH